jgi:polysaccharide biosynthesis protein PelF
MKICIIAEGCYPYIMGGVSSWIHMLVNSMPQHRFIIYAIGAERKIKGQFKYRLPLNVISVKEVFLDEYMYSDSEWGKRYEISPTQKEAIKALICGLNQVDWNAIFSFVNSAKFANVCSFLMSKDYFDIIQEVTEEHYTSVPFNEFFWTIRSMMLPLFQVISGDVPEADIYHSVSTGYAGIIGSYAKDIYKKPFILTEHGIYSREREEEIIKSDWLKGYFKDIWIEFFYSLSKCAYHKADKVITLFNKNKEIEIELGCSGEKIEVIPNGIDPSAFTYKDIKQRSDNFINIGAIVRVVPIKDIKTMIHGFALAKEEEKNIRLYIMGPTDEDEDYFFECEQLIKSLNVQDIVFTGVVNIKDHMGNLDFLLLTSISEGQPFALLEGMAGKKPVIATDVGSCRELVQGTADDFGDAGIVIPVMDYEKLGKSIITLSKNSDLRIHMGKSGYKRVMTLYTFETFVENYKRIYSECEVEDNGGDWIPVKKIV